MLEISWVFINPFAVLRYNLGSEAYLPLLPRITSPDHFLKVCEVTKVFEA